MGGILKFYMLIPFELYRVFYTTARLGSISKASKELFTSQPAVSYSIKQLEEKLGGQLFFRNAKGVSLTAEGEILYQYIEKGCSLILSGERKFGELKDMTLGQLRIAVCSAVCKNDLLKPITHYHQLYPDIRIHVRDESSHEISRLLDTGDIDIGMINFHENNNEQLNIVKEIKKEMCFVAGKKYEALSSNPISLRALTEATPLIALNKGGSTRKVLDQFLLSNGINKNPQIELSTLELIVEFTINGLGIACVTKDYVAKELACKKLYLIPLLEPLPKINLAVVLKKGMPVSTASEKFLELLNQ